MGASLVDTDGGDIVIQLRDDAQREGGCAVRYFQCGVFVEVIERMVYRTVY